MSKWPPLPPHCRGGVMVGVVVVVVVVGASDVDGVVVVGVPDCRA